MTIDAAIEQSALSFQHDFPVFQREEEGVRSGLAFHYLDNAATTERPQCVIDALTEHYLNTNANPYRGMYRDSLMATAEYEQARIETATFVGVDPDELIFTRNTTESINLVATSYALAHIKEGDEIVLPISEHHSNLVPWQRVCERTGARLVFMKIDDQGMIPEEEFEKIGPRTKLVACTHISNVLGTIFPIERIAAIAHSKGARVLVDCAQSAGHLPLRFHEWDVDFAAFSGHKMYGPMGIGALFIKRELQEQMEPFMLGGEMVDTVWEQKTAFQTGPRKFEAGTPNVDGAIGLREAIRYVQSVGFDEIQRREQELTGYLLDRLRALPQVTIYGSVEPNQTRAGIVSFNVAGVDPQDVGLMLDAHNVCIRTGSHCAQPLHRRLGVERSCRASLGIYNTKDDIDALVDPLNSLRDVVTKRILGMFP